VVDRQYVDPARKGVDVHTRTGCPPFCSIVPPYLLKRLAESGDPEQQEAAHATLTSIAVLRERRTLVTRVMAASVDLRTLGLAPAGAESAISVYDAQGAPMNSTTRLPGTLRRGPDDPPVGDDVNVDQAFDGARATIDFYRDVLERHGIDGRGMDVISSVHVTDPAGRPWENAAWNTEQMLYGDGGRIFKRGSLTSAIDVIGHELTHGVTQYTAGLEYRSQPGALNESMSDVFGSMVKQRGLGQTSDAADWLIGEGLLKDAGAAALRSMKAPGTAYDGDPQPATMADYHELPETEEGDNGGVHINSGIPNHAFYLVATGLGGNAWDRAGKIWYAALTERLQSDSQFADAAEATIAAAQALFPGDEVSGIVEDAWKQVQVL
jgi:Zn-dependent metalloprotease